MTISAFCRYGLSIAVALTTLAACSASQTTMAIPPSGTAANFTRLSAQRDAALTIPHFVQTGVHPDRGQSWMRPDKRSDLLYVGDWATNDVFVYELPSGKAVGTLTGNDEPYGMCVDTKQDVYIANFGNGTLVEYAHGVGKPLNIYTPGGEPIGCSVDAKGDVSATSFDPGEVTVYAKGNPKDGAIFSDSSCEYMWAMGYDSKGNLVGIGEESSIDACALLAGSKTETTLTESGITIDFPGGTTWDGKYLALGDQEAGGTFQSGVWPATISGTTITAATSEVKFQETCYSDYTDIINPFFLEKNFVPVTLASKHRAKYMIGPNLWCTDAGEPSVGIWYYPSGKLDKTVSFGSSSPPQEPYGAAVSAGT
jgi:hypothetical protein